MLLGLAALAQDRGEGAVRQVMIEEQLTIRVPVRLRQVSPIEWRERKGPKCFPAATIRGAMLSGPSSVDFLLRDRSRVRAELDSDCHSLDFYGGFYLQPADEKLCARRDAIRSRMGGQCRIDRFRSLEPRLRG